MRGTGLAVIVFACLAAACSGGKGSNSKLSYDDSSATTRAIAGNAAESAPAGGASTVADSQTEATARLSPGCSATTLPAELLAGIETTSSGYRTFVLHFPSAVPAGVPMPLVMNFHGSSRTGAVQEEYSGLTDLADEHGFLLVSPDALGGSDSGWNVPGVYHEYGIDDVEFVMEMLTAIGDQYCLDLDRVYATGHSNGAEMASQLACYRGDAFAAIAPVSGVVFQGCNSGAIPVLSFHGTWDDAVPYDYGYSSAEQWAGFNGCDGDIETEDYSEHVDLVRFTGCPEGAEVVFYSIDGGGHTWPGAVPNSYGEGPTTDEVNASMVMWEFFTSHPKMHIPSAYVDSFAAYAPSYNPGFEPTYETEGESGEGETRPPEPTPEPAAESTPVSESTPPAEPKPVAGSTPTPSP